VILRRAFTRVRLLAPLALLAACSRGSAPSEHGAPITAFVAPAAASSAAASGEVALPANALAVPLVRQETNYSCGDAVVLALLRYWKQDQYAATKESALYAPLETTAEDGTDPHPMGAYLSSLGLGADYRDGVETTLRDLESAIDRHEPPIVNLQAWRDEQTNKADWATDWDDGHYVVLVGYDSARWYFMDPSTDGEYAFMPKAELEDRWHDVVGPASVHTQHITLFVHGDGSALDPTTRTSERAARME
jgi:predicted double-glycine peptidase